ncbi:hypothetical protein DFH08DRAFT_977220 [Mycena albidolilacea]|uniref:Uncharacterized protein n=1 Tax=Mycena albidolilacea TaxID=1033008 RepID=A0AAD6Z189_9AGAR|nr:hypothetical protein DFH08DRAFT_977220 [Mycena albidolilacea]
MVTFILGLETEILDLVTKVPELGCCVAFVNFVNAIGGRIHEFGRDGLKNFAPAQVYSRAGYLGPKGKDVIIDTMARMFSPHFPQLKENLLATILSIISTNGESFDPPAQGTLPEILLIYDFMEFVLLPHVTARIISDDMQLSSSPPNKYALKPHPDYNDESTVATRVSRSSQKEVELTLDDFPVRKHEKKAKKPPAKTVQKPKYVCEVWVTTHSRTSFPFAMMGTPPPAFAMSIGPLTSIVPAIRRTRALIHADTYTPTQLFTIPLVSSCPGTPAQWTIQLRLGFVAPTPPIAHAPNQAQVDFEVVYRTLVKNTGRSLVSVPPVHPVFCSTLFVSLVLCLCDARRDEGSRVVLLLFLPALGLQAPGSRLQAMHLILSSPSPLTTLKYMHALALRVPRVPLPQPRDELDMNQLKAQAGISVFLLNGVTLPEKDVTALGLLRAVRKERMLMGALAGLGLGRVKALAVLTHEGVSGALEKAGRGAGRDIRRERSERGRGELSDANGRCRYAKWAPSIRSCLPLYPGQFHNIRLNLFNIVLMLDLSRPAALRTLTDAIANIVAWGLLFRFGVVPLRETEEGTKTAKLFYHSVRNYGRKWTMEFLKAVLATSFIPAGPEPKLDWDAVKMAFEAEVLEGTPATEESMLDFDAIIGSCASEVGTSAEYRWCGRWRGAAAMSSDSAPAWLRLQRGTELMQNEVAVQMQHFQEAPYSGKISDETTDKINTCFYDLPTSTLRRNRYIFPAPGDLRIVSLPELFSRTSASSPTIFIAPQLGCPPNASIW